MAPTGKGKLLAILTGALGLGCAALLWFMVGRNFVDDRDLEVADPAHPRKGQKVYISSGRIRLLDLAQFMGDYAGLPILVDSEIQRAEVMVTHDMDDVDLELAKALLDSNGFALKKEKLANGRHVLRVKAKGADRSR